MVEAVAAPARISAEQQRMPSRCELGLHDLGRVGVLAVRMCALSLSSVTWLPSRWKACASSQPIGPAPMTRQAPRPLGQEKTVSLVR